jgi:GT2 family glycosyltransferase
MAFALVPYQNINDLMNHSMDTTAPELTVLIASFNARTTIEACLNSLRSQRTERCFEIILIDSGTDNTAAVVASQYPEVMLIHLPKRLYCGDARNLGIAKARAQLVAFLDADCIVPENWAEAICDAHSHSSLTVAGSVQNGSRSLASWTYYFCEFNLWIPARIPRQIREAPGCALSMKRSAFDRFGPFPEGTYCSDTAFHWRMQEAGESVLFWPAIVVHHTYHKSWKHLFSHIVEHRRHFAAIEVREHKWGSGRRLMAILTLPFLPFLLLAAVAWRLRRAPRLYIPYLAAASPTFLGFCARTYGQFLGYISRK